MIERPQWKERPVILMGLLFDLKSLFEHFE